MTAASPSDEAALDDLVRDAAIALQAARTEAELREINAKILGRNGSLTQFLRRLGSMPPEERKALGGLVNRAKAQVEASFAERLGALQAAERQAVLERERPDLTLPGRVPWPEGHAHPVTLVQRELIEIFESLGFSVAEGPEVELEENNFTKLGFPPDHPATDMQDTFWTRAGALLRTHTSTVQVRVMTTQKPPLAVVAPGAVYRRDDDATHSPMFHQIEGLLVDEDVTLAHLQGVLFEFAQRFYGPNTAVRLRPSYFPFVEPGAEMDIGCVFCKRPDGTRVGCAICKNTGWMEILGCGMIHPVVFEHCGIDPERYTGFAFGMGIDRQAMLRFGIPNIRVLYENDPRVLEQFPS